MSTTTLPTGPALALTDEKGRWYEHPITGERFISVTTALRAVSKEGLIFWAANLAAQSALDQIPRLIAATLKKPCERTFHRCEHDFRVTCTQCPCGECMPCVGKWLRDRHIVEKSRRASEGTRVHDVIEHWVLNDGEIREHDDDIALYVLQFIKFTADYGLSPDSWEMSEATVINREYGYAGTLDQQIRFRADGTPAAADLCARLGRQGEVLLLGDNKTREKPDAAIYPDHALQCAAYRNATHVLLPDGQEHPLSPVDGTFILQLRPDGYELRLVVADDTTFGAFLSVLSLAKWQWEYATASVSPKTFPKPKPATAPASKAALRTPAKKAMPTKTATGRPIEDVPLPEPTRNSAILRLLRDTTPKLPDDGIPF